MNKWNYKSELKASNGYEDVLPELKKWNKASFLNESDDKQIEIVDSIFKIYRGKNIFPIKYFNEEGVRNEILKCRDKEVSFEGDVLNLNYNQGSAVCRFIFPNLSGVECKQATDNSPMSKFMNDRKLKKAIDFCLRYKSSNCPITPSGLKDGIEMMGGNVATNFKPMNAKALYEKYCPENGVIYDFASGFGGRMLGALSSKKNFRYIGVDPCTETYDNLNILGNEIEKATNRVNIFRVFKKGSEDFRTKKESWADFSFSSPPYFTLEKYSDEETQCYIKFPTLDEWFEGYVKETIKNIHYMLKPNAFYAVNIADFNIGKDRVEYVDRWKEMSEDCGFEFIEQIYMKLQTRRGNGHGINKKSKQEGIFVFRKK